MNIAGFFCPCLKPSPNSSSSSSINRNGPLETELISQQSRGEDGQSSLSSLYKISQKMSAPTIQIQGLNVRGCGLALVDVSIEQDCAYWEWHVNVNDNDSGNIRKDNADSGGDDDDDDDDFFSQGLTLKFGVATKKSREFYRALDSNQEDDAMTMEDGTALMKPIQNIQNGDTIGIAVQQDDLPMIQFLLNGEPLHEIAINRFRGMVYPSIYIESDGDGDVDDSVDVQFVWREEDFQEMSPSVRFKPLMAAIGII